MRTGRIKKARKRIRKNPFFSPHENSGFFAVQPKLDIGQPDDRYEQEADRIADTVVNKTQHLNSNASDLSGKLFFRKSGEFFQEKPLAESITPVLQKQVEEEEIQPKQLKDIQRQEEEEMVQAQAEEEEEGPVQMQEEEEEEMLQPKYFNKSGRLNPNGSTVASSNTESKIKNSTSNGNKMDNTTRSEMEAGFGADFSGVNIHTDTEAVQMNRELGAQAFTHGNDIYFNKGKYNPGSTDGKHLLAHELTHTIQQTGMIPNTLQRTIGDNRDLQSARFSGDMVLEACLDSEQTLSFGSRGAAVTKVQQALVDAGFPLPVYGVDGIFMSETQGALQDFQRASSLSPTGIVDAATMSSLDALFYLDQPMLPTGPAADVAPEIMSDTLNFAPNSADPTRTDVGVGEMVRFYGNTAGTWTATEGRIIGLNTGENMLWEAPPEAANPTVTLTTPSGSASINMTVIAPGSINMNYRSSDNIAVGTAGACMRADFIVHPLNVSFGRVEISEVPGPATNVSGYFSAATDNLAHTTAGHYAALNNDNATVDHASYHSLSAPYSDGMFQWVIPNRYKIEGEPDSEGRHYVDTVQSFYFTSTGTMLISKAGTFVLRFVNGTVIHGV